MLPPPPVVIMTDDNDILHLAAGDCTTHVYPAATLSEVTFFDSETQARKFLRFRGMEMKKEWHFAVFTFQCHTILQEEKPHAPR